jgi:transcription antitermination protein NusB
MDTSTDRRATNARAVARRLAVQGIYRWLLNDGPWQDVLQEFSDAEDMPKADREYFRVLLEGVCGGRPQLDIDLEQWTDRPAVQLDPVEHAVLLVALFELAARPELPFRVVLNEAVNLTRRFGATDGYKFVNAVLDRAARAVRSHEV